MSIYDLTTLIRDINNYLTKKNLKNDILAFDLLEIEDLIEKYNGKDYLDYVIESNKTYQKVKVPLENDFSNLYDIYILTWAPYQESMIHDHSKNGCIVKVIEGQITEKQFTPSIDNPQLISQSKIKLGNHGYINNEIAFHQVGNLHNERAVTLHIYSPPGYQCNYYQTNNK